VVSRSPSSEILVDDAEDRRLLAGQVVKWLSRWEDDEIDLSVLKGRQRPGRVS
jgi:hypothetical protein